MPAPSKQSIWVSYWYRALGERCGLYLKTPDPAQLKSLLYSARARSKDPSIAHLQLRMSPLDPSGEIFIFNPLSLHIPGAGG